MHFNGPNTTVTAKTLLFLFIALIVYNPVHPPLGAIEYCDMGYITMYLYSVATQYGVYNST